MITYLYPFISVAIISLVSLVGVFALSIKEEILKKYLFVLVSLAVGGLLGDAFIHLIPEALEEMSNPTFAAIGVIAGILMFFVLEKALHWHHHDLPDNAPHPLGRLVLISDGAHNLIDGMIIGASFLISPEIGLATTLAVILHEIPQEIGDFGVLLHAGYTKSKALWLNFFSALLAFVGVVLAIALGNAVEEFSLWLLPITAGGFIYIAMSDLIPELHKTTNGSRNSFVQLLSITVGVLAMVALLALEM